jgi:hypothetical protein
VQAVGVKKHSPAGEDAAAVNPSIFCSVVVAARTDTLSPTIATEGLIGIAAFRSIAKSFSAGVEMRLARRDETRRQASKARIYRLNKAGDYTQVYIAYDFPVEPWSLSAIRTRSANDFARIFRMT